MGFSLKEKNIILLLKFTVKTCLVRSQRLKEQIKEKKLMFHFFIGRLFLRPQYFPHFLYL